MEGARHGSGGPSHGSAACRGPRLRNRSFAADEARAHEDAITGVVSGRQIQKVGFRAMIEKHAIMLNLAGSARNNPDGTVSISLQGDKDRIGKALEAIRAGSKRSSNDNKVNVVNGPSDPNLKTFTVFGWTSTSRNITNPYDLIFHLRPTDDELSRNRPRRPGTRSLKAR